MHIISERDRIDYTFSNPIRFLMLSFIKFDHWNREISFYVMVNNFLHNAIMFLGSHPHLCLMYYIYWLSGSPF